MGAGGLSRVSVPLLVLPPGGLAKSADADPVLSVLSLVTVRGMAPNCLEGLAYILLLAGSPKFLAGELVAAVVETELSVGGENVAAALGLANVPAADGAPEPAAAGFAKAFAAVGDCAFIAAGLPKVLAADPAPPLLLV